LNPLIASFDLTSSVILFGFAFENMFRYAATVVVFNGEGADLNPAPSVLSLRIVQSVKNFWINNRPGLQLSADHGGQIHHSV
jgi:hypothetical protein